MSERPPGAPAGTLYTYGGDEWILVQLDEAMSLSANARALAMADELRRNRLDGIREICPANAGLLVGLDPDVIDPHAAMDHLKQIEEQVGDASEFRLDTRIVEVPVHFEDEWTYETQMRFRDRHQTPDKSDIEFAAELNGYSSTQGLLDAITSAPFIVSMVGFVPGLPWCYQLVPAERQIEVPKYVRPRTDTPGLAFGWGGAFVALYPVRGAGGYQLFGRCPVPIFDPAQASPDFKDSIVFMRPGDILSFTQVDRTEYDRIVAEVEAGSYRYLTHDVEFIPLEAEKDPDGVAASLKEVLHGA